MDGEAVSSHFRRAGATLLLCLAITLALGVNSASATIFDPGEAIGKFKVLGGHFRQSVTFIASYERGSFDGCYVYKFYDDGGANYDFTYDRGQVSPLKYKRGYVDFRRDLKVTGTASRKWNGKTSWGRSSTYDPDSCPAPDPPHYSNAGCGTKRVSGAVTGLELFAVRNGYLAKDGADGSLWGPVYSPDPLLPCPGDSIYESLALDAIAPGAMRKLDFAHVGDKVKLSASAKETSSSSKGFFVNGDWVSGSQHVEVDWALNLKRVKG